MINRAKLYEHDSKYELSYTQIQYRSKECEGGNDYYQLVLDENEKVVLVLWLLDSGGGTIQENVCGDSVRWIEETHS